MSLIFVNLGTIVYSVTGAASVAPAPPAHNAGDLMVMAIGIHTTGTKTVTVPANWSEVSDAELLGGSGAFAADTGTCRGKLLYRVAPDTSTSAITVTLAGTETGSVAYGAIAVFRATSGLYSIAGANGNDTTTGTPFTAAMNVDPGLVANDHVLVAGTIPTDVTTAAQFSAETLTATGITTTVTELGEPDSNAGNDIGGVICRATIDTGPATTVATFSATAGGTTTNVMGPLVLARIREIIPVEVAGDLAVTADLSAAGEAIHPVDGTLAVTAGLSGDAAGDRPVDGSLALTATLAGDASVTPAGAQVNVDGSLTATATMTGTAAVDVTVAGSLATTATLTGLAAVDRPASGDLAVTATLSGAAYTAVAVAGTLPVTASRTGEASVATPGQVNVDGVRGITATITGAATAEWSLTGALVATATITGAASADWAVGGDLPVTTVLTGTAGLDQSVDGTLPLTVTLTGTATVTAGNVLARSVDSATARVASTSTATRRHGPSATLVPAGTSVSTVG